MPEGTGLAWLLLPLRVYLGVQWFNAGWQKLNAAGWMQTGDSLRIFWLHAVDAPVGGTRGVVHYGWYHAFLSFMLTHAWYHWFAKLVAAGETSIGILLILGAFTGLAACLGAFLNFNYMLAGSASANPVLFSISILLILTWRVAGYVGLDYFLLRPLRRSRTWTSHGTHPRISYIGAARQHGAGRHREERRSGAGRRMGARPASR